jgi:hypothetical protein
MELWCPPYIWMPMNKYRSNEDCVQAVLKFEAADTNNDGYLSYSEVRASLPSWSEHEVRRYFNKMDNDGDGRISTKVTFHCVSRLICFQPSPSASQFSFALTRLRMPV